MFKSPPFEHHSANLATHKNTVANSSAHQSDTSKFNRRYKLSAKMCKYGFSLIKSCIILNQCSKLELQHLLIYCGRNDNQVVLNWLQPQSNIIDQTQKKKNLSLEPELSVTQLC